jgi:glycosyltransferase involved in cell wall biosynthesis
MSSPTLGQVLIVQRRLAHYRVAFFDLLHERLAALGIALRVCVGPPGSVELERRDNARSDLVDEVPVLTSALGPFGGYLHRIPRRWLRSTSLVIAPHENRALTSSWLLARQAHFGFKIALWGHGMNLSKPRESGPGFWMRRWMLRSADRYFAYTCRSRDQLLAAGFPRERITVVNNSKRVPEPDATDALRIDNLRRTLGIQGSTCAIVLGSLAHDRMLDLLLGAARRIRAAIPEFQMVVIGDGPVAPAVKAFCADHRWVHWVGARFGADLLAYASLGSLMLNPSRVGLNMIDSLAMGLPMVTMDLDTQFPEFAYLEDGRNGFVTPCGLESYAATVIRLLREPERLHRARIQCLADAGRYTLERMVDAFVEGICATLAVTIATTAPEPRAVTTSRPAAHSSI